MIRGAKINRNDLPDSILRAQIRTFEIFEASVQVPAILLLHCECNHLSKNDATMYVLVFNI